MRFRHTVLLPALLLLAFAVPATAQTGPTKIKIGTPGGDANALAWYAQDQGFFGRVGLDADVQMMRGSGAGITAAVVGGAIDVGEADLIAIAAARQHGIPLVILAASGMYSASAPTTVLVTSKSSPLRSAKDLNGKTVGVLSLEGPSKVGTATWIDKNGGNSKTVKFVELPAPQAGAAVARGTVAAATIPEPFLTASLDKTRVFADVYTAISPRFEISAWFATADWVKRNPAAAKAVGEAMRAAAGWANNAANHAKSAEILAAHTKLPLAVLGKMNRATYGYAYDTTQAQPLLDAAYRYRSIARPEAARDLLAS